MKNCKCFPAVHDYKSSFSCILTCFVSKLQNVVQNNSLCFALKSYFCTKKTLLFCIKYSLTCAKHKFFLQDMYFLLFVHKKESCSFCFLVRIENLPTAGHFSGESFEALYSIDNLKDNTWFSQSSPGLVFMWAPDSLNAHLRRMFDNKCLWWIR